MNTVYPANEEFPIPCTHCRRVVDVAAEFTMFNDYGDVEIVRLCADCLQEALDGVKAAGGVGEVG